MNGFSLNQMFRNEWFWQVLTTLLEISPPRQLEVGVCLEFCTPRPWGRGCPCRTSRAPGGRQPRQTRTGGLPPCPPRPASLAPSACCWCASCRGELSRKTEQHLEPFPQLHGEPRRCWIFRPVELRGVEPHPGLYQQDHLLVGLVELDQVRFVVDIINLVYSHPKILL